MPLRAVIFDYGMVLSGHQDQAAHRELVELTGLTTEEFERYYWIDRHAYDLGELTGMGFWRKLAKDAGLNLSEATIERCNHLDAVMWSTENLSMIAWQFELKQHGLRTGILSNMGDSIHEALAGKFAWLERFDVRVWSYQLGIAKPDPAIYHHILKALSVAPEEALFLDDRLDNIEAARALGIHAIQFSTVERLRADLIALGLDREFPLP